MQTALPGLLIEIEGKFSIIALLYARIIPIFLILPILNSGVLSSLLIRNGIIFTIIIGLWPMIDTTALVVHSDLLGDAMLIGKEVIVGASIGFVMALPFWIFNALGAFIDVARGSSMGSLIDPTNGQESTEMQNYINFCVCALYMQLGGLNMVLESLVRSYRDIVPAQNFEIRLDFILPYLTQIFEHGFVLAAPVLLTLLLTEALLGLLSRFTPQLSAFSVAMTIKSSIAIFVLSLYFWHIAPDSVPQMMRSYAHWSFVKGVN